MKSIRLTAMALGALLATSAAHAGTISLWGSSATKPTGYVNGTAINPSGANNKYFQWNVSDSEFPEYGTFAITAKGYATANNNGTGAFSQRDLERYNGGLGVCDDTSCSSPQHATDNDGKDDLIVIDLGVGHTYSPTQFSIGWTAYGDCTSTHASNSCPDIQAWIGNDFDASQGWAGITSTWTQILSGDPSNDIQPGQDYYFGAGIGRYLIIAPQTGSEQCVQFRRQQCTSTQYDYFKLESLVFEATRSAEVPEPTSAALLGVTLASLLAVGRRRRQR